MEIKGESKDQMVVKGENVDLVCLGRRLKKKFRGVMIVKVEETKAKKDEKKDKCCCKCSIKCDDDNKCKKAIIKASSKCDSPKCEGDCKPNSNTKPKAYCFKCGTWWCQGECTMCFGQCPPWKPCIKYCVKFPPYTPTSYGFAGPCLPPPTTNCHDQCNVGDGCFIQ